jgi:Zn-dependent peptidase ImmA (M78 family)
MNLYLSQIKQVVPQWNEKPLSEDDLQRIARKLKARVHYLKFRVKGFYMRSKVRGRWQDQIYIDMRSPRAMQTFVLAHEIFHVIRHSPQDVGATFYFGMKDSKEEHEANMFASVCLIPLAMLQRLTPAEICEEIGCGPEVVEFRETAFARYNV